LVVTTPDRHPDLLQPRTYLKEDTIDEMDVKKLVADDEHAIDSETLDALRRDARRYTVGGRWMFCVAIAVGICLLVFSHFLTVLYVHDLNHAENPEFMLPLLLVRGVLFGGLGVGFLYGIFTVGNAYIDQATRFRKRLYSAHMLNYAFKAFREDIKKGGQVDVDDLVRLFEAWNANVDSAFSRVAFQKRSKNLVFKSGNHHFSTEDPPEDIEGR
jgi:hypothetical protein